MNVHDELKNLEPEEIQALVQMNSIPAAIGMYNVSGNLNLGSIIRTANFLGFKEVLYFGRRKWDRRGAVGTHNYTNLEYFEDSETFMETVRSRGYNIVCLENNVPWTRPIRKFIWPQNPIIMVGEEGSGIPTEVLEDSYGAVEILGRGSVRSLNVSAAAAIAMYDLTVRGL